MKNCFFNITTFLTAVGMALLLASCSKEDSINVNQDSIYTDYEVFYNENSDKTWVVARFRFGGATGTLLELSDGASVTFNGDLLPYNALFGGHFKEYAGQVLTGTFSYTDLESNTFSNLLPAYDSIAYPTDFDTINVNVANELIWEGSALADNQNVALFIGTSWKWGDDALFVETNLGATSLIMGTNQLANLTIGPATVFMNRTTDIAVTEGTSEGGRIRGKYRPKNVDIQVIN